MDFPTRFRTGVRNTTIVNPAWLHKNFNDNEHGAIRCLTQPVTTFEGQCSDYNFRQQTKNFKALQAVLKRNGTDFLYVAAASYTGDVKNHRFVACSADGSLLWNKYVGYIAQGGQNHVYVSGMRIKVSVFLSQPEYKQNALLSNSKLMLMSAFGTNFDFKTLDESSDLWS